MFLPSVRATTGAPAPNATAPRPPEPRCGRTMLSRAPPWPRRAMPSSSVALLKRCVPHPREPGLAVVVPAGAAPCRCGASLGCRGRAPTLPRARQWKKKDRCFFCSFIILPSDAWGSVGSEIEMKMKLYQTPLASPALSGSYVQTLNLLAQKLWALGDI